MSRLRPLLGTLLIIALTLSCSSDNDGNTKTRTTAQNLTNLRQRALSNLTQTFSFNAEKGGVFKSKKGVTINLAGGCLTQNGSPVKGPVTLKFIELFEKGDMLITNRTTMGLLPDGNQALLISGGEFFIEATQNEIVLDIKSKCKIRLNVPTDLTGGDDKNMTLWTGVIDESNNLVWEETENSQGNGGVEVIPEGGIYYSFFSNLGWCNIDRFYRTTEQKTTISASVPEGYDSTNSAVYLSFNDGDTGTGLANFGTYNHETKSFEAQQLPVGLKCHIIFATEDNKKWRYAIKPITIAENGVYTFTYAETSEATEEELTIKINALL